MHLIIVVNNAISQAHGFVSLIIVTLTVIINAKPCAWLMALLTKIMRCILQVRAQEQPLQCIFSYTMLANPEVEPHAPNTYQSKLVPSGSTLS